MMVGALLLAFCGAVIVMLVISEIAEALSKRLSVQRGNGKSDDPTRPRPPAPRSHLR